MHPKARVIEIADELYSIPEAVAALREACKRQDPGWVAEVDRLGAWMYERLPSGPDGFNPGQWQQMPPWVRLQLLDTWLTWSTGKATTCVHVPTVERPQPVFAALWTPGLVSCGQCSQYLLRLTGEADRTCDGCGRVVAGLESGDGIHPCGVMFGPMLLFWGACQDCRPRELARVRRRNGRHKGKR